MGKRSRNRGTNGGGGGGGDGGNGQNSQWSSGSESHNGNGNGNWNNQGNMNNHGNRNGQGSWNNGNGNGGGNWHNNNNNNNQGNGWIQNKPHTNGRPRNNHYNGNNNGNNFNNNGGGRGSSGGRNRHNSGRHSGQEEGARARLRPSANEFSALGAQTVSNIIGNFDVTQIGFGLGQRQAQVSIMGNTVHVPCPWASLKSDRDGDVIMCECNGGHAMPQCYIRMFLELCGEALYWRQEYDKGQQAQALLTELVGAMRSGIPGLDTQATRAILAGTARRDAECEEVL